MGIDQNQTSFELQRDITVGDLQKEIKEINQELKDSENKNEINELKENISELYDV